MNTGIFIELTDYKSREKLTIDGNFRLFNQLLKSIQEQQKFTDTSEALTENGKETEQVEKPVN